MRLFVAINVPSSVRSGIWETAAPLRDGGYPVKWVGRDGIHLTLKFLGEVEPARLERVEGELTAAILGTKQFPLPICGFGAFPTPARPRVVWVGCEGIAPLEILQHEVELAMQRSGFPAEARPFRPHLTLGRVKRGARSASLAGLGAELERLEFTAEPLVASVDLMQSRLSPGGARYERLHAVELAP